MNIDPNGKTPPRIIITRGSMNLKHNRNVSVIHQRQTLYDKHINISGTNVDICKQLTALLFLHGVLCDTSKNSRGKFHHSTTLEVLLICLHIINSKMRRKNLKTDKNMKICIKPG